VRLAVTEIWTDILK